MHCIGKNKSKVWTYFIARFPLCQPRVDERLWIFKRHFVWDSNQFRLLQCKINHRQIPFKLFSVSTLHKKKLRRHALVLQPRGLRWRAQMRSPLSGWSAAASRTPSHSCCRHHSWSLHTGTVGPCASSKFSVRSISCTNAQRWKSSTDDLYWCRAQEGREILPVFRLADFRAEHVKR